MSILVDKQGQAVGGIPKEWRKKQKYEAQIS